MDFNPNLSAIAFLIADPARAAMLMTLADGSARPAGELAYAASVTPQTASSHLAKLLGGGLLSVEKQGRHRYYRLADQQVAAALESLATIGGSANARRKPAGRNADALRFARCCYDHLAGKIGVAVTQALVDRGFLSQGAHKRFEVTGAGLEWFGSLGVEIEGRNLGRREARQCLDWTERQHHLAGPLGVALLKAMCASGWVRRIEGSRSVQMTPVGWTELRKQLGLTPERVALIGA